MVSEREIAEWLLNYPNILLNKVSIWQCHSHIRLPLFPSFTPKLQCPLHPAIHSLLSAPSLLLFQKTLQTKSSHTHDQIISLASQICFPPCVHENAQVSGFLEGWRVLWLQEDVCKFSACSALFFPEWIGGRRVHCQSSCTAQGLHEFPHPYCTH